MSARCFEGSRGHGYRPVGTQDGHSEFAPGGCLQEPPDVLKAEGHCKVHHMAGEGASQERGKCVGLCFLSILHGRQRSVRQADVPLYFPCLLVKREIAKFISLSFLFPSLLSRKREGVFSQREKGPSPRMEMWSFMQMERGIPVERENGPFS